MLVYQGLKTSELGKLETTDINLREGKINVPGSSTESYLQNDMEGLQEEVQQFHPLG